MMNIKHLAYGILFCVALTAPLVMKAQSVRVVNFKEFQALTTKPADNDTTYVINFWATWCKPCVKELPYFEQLGQQYKGQKLKVILVSMDFVKDVKSRVEPFAKQKKLQSELLLLNEPDYNAWIDKVSPDWGGSIPATLVMNANKSYRKFYEKDFATFDELQSTVKAVTP
jgi:thiol-disulfide isomerase/thioredoxin